MPIRWNFLTEKYPKILNHHSPQKTVCICHTATKYDTDKRVSVVYIPVHSCSEPLNSFFFFERIKIRIKFDAGVEFRLNVFRIENKFPIGISLKTNNFGFFPEKLIWMKNILVWIIHFLSCDLVLEKNLPECVIRNSIRNYLISCSKNLIRRANSLISSWFLSVSSLEKIVPFPSIVHGTAPNSIWFLVIKSS